MGSTSFQKYLIDEFHIFCKEVYKIKRKVESIQNQPEEALDEDSNDQRLVESIQRKLRLVLEDQSVRIIRQVGNHVGLHFDEAKYIMVSLADEVFLSFDWFGHDFWRENMLESQLFKTQVAGEQIFKRIDDLISQHDPMRANVASIYLLVLGLGFKGKFRDQNDNGKIAYYRDQLFQVIYHHPNGLFHGGRNYIIKECYEHTITMNNSKKLPDVRRWIIIFIAVFAVFLSVSSILWYLSIRDLGQGVNNILSQNHITPGI